MHPHWWKVVQLQKIWQSILTKCIFEKTWIDPHWRKAISTQNVMIHSHNNNLWKHMHWLFLERSYLVAQILKRHLLNKVFLGKHELLQDKTRICLCIMSNSIMASPGYLFPALVWNHKTFHMWAKNYTSSFWINSNKCL